MKLIRILSAALLAVMTIGAFFINAASAAGTYKISCKNDAYGMQLGAIYQQVAYVYNAANFGTAGDLDAVTGVSGNQQYMIMGVEAYVGNDCIYAGSADTNGTAVVAGDVARLAINAIVGAVSNRIDMAYAAQNSGASATGISFSTQSDGVSMSANQVVAGLSFWADYGDTNVKNTQTFTNVRIDSNKYDGDASSYSIGVDKTLGKALVGVVISSLDTDFTTTFNDGTYKQNVDTYGIYVAYKTGVFHIDLGLGQGDSDITTTRRDLGNDKVINGTTTADIDYSNARVSAHFTRGRFLIVPNISYRSMNMDIKAFTDDRADETQSLVTGEGYLFTSGDEGHGDTDGLTVTDDAIAARRVESEIMTIGLNLSANFGKFVPFLGFSYESQSTTSAAYKTELGTDVAVGTTDTDVAASKYNSSLRIGTGINFNLNSYISGGIRAGMISARNDWEETYYSGNIKIGF
jgi:hypothetical protein